MKRIALVLLGILPAAEVLAQPAPPRAAYAIAFCQCCHGAGGNSTNSSIPRLNGQRPAYIIKRLKDFLQPVPSGPHAPQTMSDAAPDALDVLSSAAVAAFFSRQRPMAATLVPMSEKGRLIYQQGSAREGVVACRQCHGDQGEGHDAVPRIAGQHADYLKTQLWNFHFHMRGDRLMHPNITGLSADQVEALVVYLGGD